MLKRTYLDELPHKTVVKDDFVDSYEGIILTFTDGTFLYISAQGEYLKEDGGFNPLYYHSDAIKMNIINVEELESMKESKEKEKQRKEEECSRQLYESLKTRFEGK